MTSRLEILRQVIAILMHQEAGKNPITLYVRLVPGRLFPSACTPNMTHDFDFCG
jgi:hypothetical protein